MNLLGITGSCSYDVPNKGNPTVTLATRQLRRGGVQRLRELRNHTADVVEQAASGQSVVITVRGQPKAKLVAFDPQPRLMSAVEFRAGLAQADAELDDVLKGLAPETTDDLPWP
jgi:prevent-host-death family protein